MNYSAPVKDMLFTMQALAGIEEIAALPNFTDCGIDTSQAVLEESAKFCQDVIAPLNRKGDQNPPSFEAGRVTTTPGFKEAYLQFISGGWQGVIHPIKHGGQGLPKLIATACTEMLHASNLSFALCPMLTDGAIEALLTAGNDELQQKYIPRLIAGEWTGTMNLTEPQAGSDLAAVRTRAELQPDGNYRIFGTKIFITYGEHDMAENIVHLVLARLPDAPPGIKGISLFVVPKFLVNADGTLGKRNDVQCVSIEHKLGIKASPTAVLQFGDQGGAIGEIVGEPSRGLEYMFIMMNAARFAVGMQGIAVSDRAYQQALAFAKERVQSRDLTGSPEPVAIIHHPDVKRMLLTMKAHVEAARALAYCAAAYSDMAHHVEDDAVRRENLAIYEFLVPVIKGHSTELANEITSLGVQVHGGMGFIEETGAAQHYRDARILAIYEGTTAIQANDFVGRKTVRDGGAIARKLCARIEATEQELSASGLENALKVLTSLREGRLALESTIDHVVTHAKADPKAVYAGAVPYLRLAGVVLGGWQMARALLAAVARHRDDPIFALSKMATATFYAEALLPQAHSLASMVRNSGNTVASIPLELL